MIKSIIDYYASAFAELYEFIVAFWDVAFPFVFAYVVALFLALLITICVIAVS